MQKYKIRLTQSEREELETIAQNQPGTAIALRAQILLLADHDTTNTYKDKSDDTIAEMLGIAPITVARWRSRWSEFLYGTPAIQRLQHEHKQSNSARKGRKMQASDPQGQNPNRRTCASGKRAILE